MTHTEGPWSILPQNGAGPMIVHEFETGNQMNPTGYRMICNMLQRGNSLEQDKANARLIAAAPDFLEVAKRCLAMVDEGAGPPDWDWIRSIISKATS